SHVRDKIDIHEKGNFWRSQLTLRHEKTPRQGLSAGAVDGREQASLIRGFEGADLEATPIAQAFERRISGCCREGWRSVRDRPRLTRHRLPLVLLATIAVTRPTLAGARHAAGPHRLGQEPSRPRTTPRDQGQRQSMM